MLGITLNTNKAPATSYEELVYTSELSSFIRIELGNEDNWRPLVTVEPSFAAIDNIDVSAIGIERGPKNHRIHAHFVVTIQHRGTVGWKYHQKDWQRLVNAKLWYTRGSYVSIQLLNSRQLNYTTKTAGTVTQLFAQGAQQPVVF